MKQVSITGLRTPLDGITEAVNVNLGKLRQMVRDREAWHTAVHGVTELDTTGWLNNNSTSVGSTWQ